MDISVTIIQLYDASAIQSVMMHEDILPDIVDDTWDGAVYQPDIINEIFLGFVVGDSLIGVYRLHWTGGSVLHAHAHILKKHRREYSQASAKMVMEWLLCHIERCKKVECVVPFLYPNVKAFLLSVGFTQEGVSRSSYLKGGQMYDKWIMGITQDEMKEKVDA